MKLTHSLSIGLLLAVSACASDPDSKSPLHAKTDDPAVIEAARNDPQVVPQTEQMPQKANAALRSGTAADVVAVLGETAPDFALADQNDALHYLADFRGKPVVLEWFNPECPVVRGWYDDGRMQALQQKYTEAGAIWLTICSSGEGKQGFFAADAASGLMGRENMHSTALMRDPEGFVGKAYKAKTTPHMYVIDGAGKLVYDGAIDETVDGQKRNPVALTLDALLAGQPVEPRSTRPYGCGVKYAN